MWMQCLMLVGGLALIVQGGNLFVAAAVRIAEFLRMPRVVVGSTLVSLATTTPELVVSIMSGVKGESGLAVGNAVGSCVCNIGLILGVMAIGKTVTVHPRTLWLPLATMGGFGLLLLLFTLDHRLSRLQGAILVAAGLAYFAFDFVRHWRQRDPEVRAEAVAIERDVAAVGRSWFRTRPGTAVQFVVGAGVVVLGSRLLVDGGVGVAAGLGVPSLVIGLTVVAVGTSLPEFITAITSSRSEVGDLAVGNVLGANIANLSMIVGAAAVFSEVSIDRTAQWSNFGPMLVLFAVLARMLTTRGRLSRREGMVLLGLYAAYLALVVGLAVAR